MTKKSVRVFVSTVLASTSALLSPGLVLNSLTNSIEFSQVAEAAQATKINIEPRQEYYQRGNAVKVTAKFRPNAKVVFFERYKDEHTGKIVEKIVLEVTSNSKGIASIDYTVPTEGNKDDVHVIAQGPNRKRTIRIPIGGRSVPKPPVGQPPQTEPQKPSPTPSQTEPQTPVVYPLKISSPTDKIGSKDYMQSNVSLSINPSNGTGILYSVTRTWTKNKLDGFTGGAEVVLLDANNNILYISRLRSWGVNGKWIPGAPSSRTSHWNEPISADVMKSATKIAIVHRHTPKNRLRDAFSDLKEVVNFIKPFMKLLPSSK